MDDGQVIVFFTEDISAVPFAADGMTDTDSEIDSDQTASFTSTIQQFNNNEIDDWLAHGDAWRIKDIPGYEFVPNTGVVN